MSFPRQEYWSGLPCPPPGDLPNPGAETVSLKSLALAGEFFSTTWEILYMRVYISSALWISFPFRSQPIWNNIPCPIQLAIYFINSSVCLGFSWWLSGKESSCQCNRRAFDPWSGKIPWRREWQPLQHSCLENPMDGGAWRARVRGITNSRTWLSNKTTTTKVFLH